MYDAKRLREDADCIVVAESLGIPMQTRGSKTLILCPAHDDHNFGSCFVNRRGYYCYSCHARGDVFNLVQTTLNVGFGEAANYVANLCGGERMYKRADAETADQSAPSKKPFLTAELMERLGLHDEPVWVNDLVVPTYEEAAELRKTNGWRYEETSIGYVITRIKCQSPLRDLYNNGYETYMAMVEDAFLDLKGSMENIYEGMLDANGGSADLLESYKKAKNWMMETSEKYSSSCITLDDNVEAKILADLLVGMDEIGGVF